MELSAFSLTFIAGSFTILGALIGALSSYKVANHNERLKAANQLRVKFAPALATLRQGRNEKSVDVDSVLHDALPGHAAAIEEYRFFVRSTDIAAYQKAWDEYSKLPKVALLSPSMLGTQTRIKILSRKYVQFSSLRNR